MNKISVFLFIMMFSVTLSAQNAVKTEPAPATAPATAPVAAPAPVTGAAPDAKNDEKKDDKTKRVNLPDGYGELAWGSDFLKVKESVKGKIVFAAENKTILSKDNEISYRYGFFYIDPVRTGDIPEDKAEDYEHDPKQAKLFYTMIEFPYLSLKDVRKKMSEKYGEPTGDNISNNRGALVWESEKNIIVVWVDEYEKRPFSRRITYYSKDIAKQLKDYLYKIFNSKEIDVIKKMVP
jgi:hypothetical protein